MIGTIATSARHSAPAARANHAGDDAEHPEIAAHELYAAISTASSNNPETK
jgi:hypothetical protein